MRPVVVSTGARSWLPMDGLLQKLLVQWTGKLCNLVRVMQDAGDASDHEIRTMALQGCCTPHMSTMLMLRLLGQLVAFLQCVLCIGRSLRKT